MSCVLLLLPSSIGCTQSAVRMRCQLRHVTQDDLHDFASLIKNEIAEMRCGVSLKKCYVSVDRLSDASWLSVCAAEAELRMMEGNKCCTMLLDLSQHTTL